MVMYSHSRLSTFEQCPQKFKFRYIDKIIPEIEKSIESYLGSVVHSTLEWVYTKVKDEKQTPTLDEIIIFYSEAWRRDFSQDMIIVNKELTSKDYYDKGIQFLIDYCTKHSPFNDGTIDIEKKIILSLDESNNYKIIGFIDRLAQNIHTGELEIHDYKTGNFLPSQEKFDNDRQLALYAIAIKQTYGHDKEVSLNWHYLAHNKKITSKRTNKQLEQLKKETIELIKQIENTNKFPPAKSALCDWCEYKNQCPLFSNSQNTTQTKQENIAKYPTISKYIKD